MKNKKCTKMTIMLGVKYRFFFFSFFVSLGHTKCKHNFIYQSASLFINSFYVLFPVVAQDYTTRAQDVYVIIGNSALMKCEVPSFVTDFVQVFSWVNGKGEEYFISNTPTNGIIIIFLNTIHAGTHKLYRGKFLYIKYLFQHVRSSFFDEIVSVLTYRYLFFSVVSQEYTSGAHEVYVIVGNAALIKCDIPSFVADFVSVISWVDNENFEYFPTNTNGRY